MKSWSEFCGQTIAGRYELADSVIGVGSLGAVYQARDLQSGQQVAVKLLHSKLGLSGDFDDSCLRVKHARFVPVRDAGLIDGEYPFIAMDLIKAPRLRGPVKPAEVSLFLKGIATALKAADAEHELNHLNLNPRNIFMEGSVGSHRPLLADFGHAAQIGALEVQIEAIRNRVVGPEYLSPEQLRGQGPSRQSDVYSVGVILFELLTGRVPFQATGSTLDAFLEHLEKTSPPMISALAPDLGIESFVEATIARCLSLNPSGRPGSVAELDDLIGAALAGRSGDTIAPGTIAPAPTEAFDSDDSFDNAPDSVEPEPERATARGSDTWNVSAPSMAVTSPDAETDSGPYEEYDPWAGLGPVSEANDAPTADQPKNDSDGAISPTEQTLLPGQLPPTKSRLLPNPVAPSARPAIPASPTVATTPAPARVAPPAAVPPSKPVVPAPARSEGAQSDSTLVPDALPPVRPEFEPAPPRSPTARTVDRDATTNSDRLPVKSAAPVPSDGTLLPGAAEILADAPVDYFAGDTPAAVSQPTTYPEPSRGSRRPATRSGIPGAVLAIGIVLGLLAGGAGGFAFLRKGSLTETALKHARDAHYDQAAATIAVADPLTSLLFDASEVRRQVFDLGVENVNNLIDENQSGVAIEQVDALAQAIPGRDQDADELRHRIARPVRDKIQTLAEDGDYESALERIDSSDVQKLGKAVPDVLEPARLREDVRDRLIDDLRKRVERKDFVSALKLKPMQFLFSENQELVDLLVQASFLQKLDTVQSESAAGRHSDALKVAHELVAEFGTTSQESDARRARVEVADRAARAAVAEKNTGHASEIWQVAIDDVRWLRTQPSGNAADPGQLCQLHLARGQALYTDSFNPLSVEQAARGLTEMKSILSLKPDHAECLAVLTETAGRHAELANESLENAARAAGQDPAQEQLENQNVVGHASVALDGYAVLQRTDSPVPQLHYARAFSSTLVAPRSYAQARADFEKFLTLIESDKSDDAGLSRARAQYQLAEILAAAPDDALRQGERAVTLAETAETYLFDAGAKPGAGADDLFLNLIKARQALAAAYAETGQFDAAVEITRGGILDELDAGNERHRVFKLQNELRAADWYEKKRPYRLPQ